MARKDRFALDTLDSAETAALEADAGAPLPEPEAGAARIKPDRGLAAVEEEPIVEAATEGESEGEAEVEGAAPAAQKPGMVPHAAMHEERERRKEADARALRLEQENRTLTERTNRVLESLAARQAPTEVAPADPSKTVRAVPDFAADPAGHIAALLHNQEVRLTSTQTAVADLANRGQQQTANVQQATAQAQAIQQINSRAQTLESEFKGANPDYEAALNHVVSQRHAELQALGVTDPVQRANILQQEAFGIAARSAQDNSNPAEVLYKFALARGYKKADAKAAATEGAERIAAVANGQRAQGPNLGTVAAARSPKLTAQSLLAMSAADFDKMLDTPAGRELMGN